MKFFNTAAVLLVAASAGSTLAAPTPATEASLAVRDVSDLSKRTIGSWPCINFFGFIRFGSCGSWGKDKYESWTNTCNKYDFNADWKKEGDKFLYAWKNIHVPDFDWQYYGKNFLPKDCNKWEFTAPEPYFPTSKCTQKHWDGYHKACYQKGWQPHAWYDSSKGSYWLYWNGKFTLDVDFVIVNDYCVPKWEQENWH